MMLLIYVWLRTVTVRTVSIKGRMFSLYASRCEQRIGVSIVATVREWVISSVPVENGGFFSDRNEEIWLNMFNGFSLILDSPKHVRNPPSYIVSTSLPLQRLQPLRQKIPRSEGQTVNKNIRIASVTVGWRKKKIKIHELFRPSVYRGNDQSRHLGLLSPWVTNAWAYIHM